MSLLTLLRRAVKVFGPRPPVRGTSVLTSPEKWFVFSAHSEIELLSADDGTPVLLADNQLFISQKRK